ncbi:hypothetical protein Msi02_09850 [Microbispora siamensis]|uniref:Uncharacterized protein n=1 Tax=Microbispora siamensis TaxID=564413 RepID=A0ABQ4GFG9_9ACTN|nr:hypothetical protein Msi02_09850 [Microbispora siamensis]GLX07306.1 hypothetical protein Misp03_42320 [Microbispora sp. NBRC 16548]
MRSVAVSGTCFTQTTMFMAGGRPPLSVRLTPRFSVRGAGYAHVMQDCQVLAGAPVQVARVSN